MAVTDEHCFVGFDAYKKVIDSGVDVVILATPPHFRPCTLQAAVEAGKHVFAEKPVAVDAPGVRSRAGNCGRGKKKNLSVVSGLCYRYDLAKRETIQRVHDGAVGDIVALHVQLQHRHTVDATPASQLERHGMAAAQLALLHLALGRLTTSSSTCTASTRPPGPCATSRRCRPPAWAAGRCARGPNTATSTTIMPWSTNTPTASSCLPIAGSRPAAAST